jgi:hypothetical protein
MLGSICYRLIIQFREGGALSIILPDYNRETHKLSLGFLGYLVLGGTAGWLVPELIGNHINSFLAGYFFVSIFEVVEKRPLPIP